MPQRPDAIYHGFKKAPTRWLALFFVKTSYHVLTIYITFHARIKPSASERISTPKNTSKTIINNYLRKNNYTRNRFGAMIAFQRPPEKGVRPRLSEVRETTTVLRRG